MEKATTDIYSFRKLRENGFTYVDKTAQILPLVDMSIGTQFFLARPRRFGKSLLVSTLHCLFEGAPRPFSGTCHRTEVGLVEDLAGAASPSPPNAARSPR